MPTSYETPKPAEVVEANKDRNEHKRNIVRFILLISVIFLLLIVYITGSDTFYINLYKASLFLVLLLNVARYSYVWYENHDYRNFIEVGFLIVEVLINVFLLCSFSIYFYNFGQELVKIAANLSIILIILVEVLTISVLTCFR